MSRLSVATALTVALLAPLSAASAQCAAAIDRFVLPAAVTFPEGVAFDAANNVLYTASAVTGEVVRVHVATKAVETVTPAGVLMPAGSTVFPGILGMKIDASGRLWIAGGRTGKMFVVDAKSGKVLKETQVTNPSASLINDVVVVGSTGYFTDTLFPRLWRVEAHGDHVMDAEPWIDFTGSALPYDTAPNLNGITATPDGRSLIVVHMGKGLLFRIDLATKVISAIDTGGADLSGADGLWLDQQTLYVVRQTAVEIATVALSADWTRGTVTARFKDAALAWPATAAKVGDRLVVVNTQFNARAANTETRPFVLLSIPVARLTAAQ
jgi:Cu-Zn family superoxide dismutase